MLHAAGAAAADAAAAGAGAAADIAAAAGVAAEYSKEAVWQKGPIVAVAAAGAAGAAGAVDHRGTAFDTEKSGTERLIAADEIVAAGAAEVAQPFAAAGAAAAAAASAGTETALKVARD